MKPVTTHWERLEQVIRASKLSVNAFAKEIGLARGENLYRIKRGNNGISQDVARRIHEHYPEYSVSLLLCSEGDTLLLGRNNPVVCIPICRNIRTTDLSDFDSSEEHLVVSASVANGAQYAVPYTDAILNPYLWNSLLLLRDSRGEEIVYGNIYFLIMGRTRIFRIVQGTDDSHCLRLTTCDPERFNDLVVPREQIDYLGIVCGAICQMQR